MKYIVSATIAAAFLVSCEQGASPKDSIWEGAEHGDVEVVEFYLDQGTDVDAKGERSWMEGTPLHHAAKGGSVEVTELLLANGADVNALGETTPLGKSVTPLDIATAYSEEDSVERKTSKETIANLLRSHGAMTAAELRN